MIFRHARSHRQPSHLTHGGPRKARLESRNSTSQGSDLGSRHSSGGEKKGILLPPPEPDEVAQALPTRARATSSRTPSLYSSMTFMPSGKIARSRVPSVGDREGKGGKGAKSGGEGGSLLHSGCLSWLSHLDAFTVVVLEMGVLDRGGATKSWEMIQHPHGRGPPLHMYSSSTGP